MASKLFLFLSSKFHPKLNGVKLPTFLIKSTSSTHHQFYSKLLSKRNKNDLISKYVLSTQKLSSTLPDQYSRDNYHDEIETLINKQINTELNAAMAYLSMACFFGRSEIALSGCQGYFLNMYHEENGHAVELINYQLMRGGFVKLCPITVLECQDWGSITKALSVALEMEKLVKEKLKCVYEAAEKHEDLQTMDLISSKFMVEQNKSICEFARLLTRAKKVTERNNVGEFLFDQIMFEAFVNRSNEKYKF